uniref:Phosphate transporter n=1 Tax=Bursaphelenchus xylophilus TaxID=6326 RepID=A0A1I7SGN4_BURXY
MLPFPITSSNHIEFHNPLNTVYHTHSESSLIIAQLSFIIAAATWVLWTSFMGIPISSSHCMAGSAMGFVIVIKGFDALHWVVLEKTLLSFLFTPIISGALALTICYLIHLTTTKKEFSNKRLTRTVSVIFLLSSALSTYGLLHGMSSDLGITPLPLHYSLCASLTVGLIIFLLVLFFIEPMLQAQVEHNVQKRALEHGMERDEKSFRVNRFKVKKINMLPKKFMISLDGETPITNHINLEGMDKMKEKASHKLRKYITSDLTGINEISRFSFGAALYFVCGFMAFFQSVENIRISVMPLNILMMVYRREAVDEKVPISPLLASYVTPVICLGIYYMGGSVLKTLSKDLGTLSVITALAAQFATTVIVNMACDFDVPHSISYCLLLAILFVSAIPKE